MANQTGNNVVSSDFLRVLLALKDNINRDLAVAEVCVVKSITASEIRCSLLSSSKKLIVCEKLKDLEIAQNDIVLVLFTSSDFRANMKRIKSNQQPIDNSKETLHSLNYGIVIGVIYKQGE